MRTSLYSTGKQWGEAVLCSTLAIPCSMCSMCFLIGTCRSSRGCEWMLRGFLEIGPSAVGVWL